MLSVLSRMMDVFMFYSFSYCISSIFSGVLRVMVL